MENLAGNKDADKFIKEELYLAGIPEITVGLQHTEVPYTIIGKVGNWTFRRAWYYWVASVENPKDGLKLENAIALHEKPHPTDAKKKILGNVIRAGGDCTCPSPKSYVAQPAYDEELDKQLTALGYKKKRYEDLNIEGWNLSYGEIGKLCDEGKLTVDRYVDCYHIDDQVGLNEFVKAIARNVIDQLNEQVAKLHKLIAEK